MYDQVAGSQFKKPEDKQLYKDYMELGSFSRGSAKGTIQGETRFVCNRDLDGEIKTIARNYHLFLPFPETVRNDMAFHDRWHAYLPGREMPKMQPDYFTAHLGFAADYFAEIHHHTLRPQSSRISVISIFSAALTSKSGIARPSPRLHQAESSSFIPTASAPSRN